MPKKLTRREIESIIMEEYDILPPSERAAQKLWKLGVREDDLMVKGSLIPDHYVLNVRMVLRDMERRDN